MLNRKQTVTPWNERKAVLEARERVTRLRTDLEAEGEAYAEQKAKAQALKAEALQAGVDGILSGNETAAEKARKASKAAADALEVKGERIELLQATLTRAEQIQREAEAKAKRDFETEARAAIDKQLGAVLDQAVTLHNQLIEVCACNEYQSSTHNVRTAVDRLAYQMGFSIDALQTAK